MRNKNTNTIFTTAEFLKYNILLSDHVNKIKKNAVLNADTGAFVSMEGLSNITANAKSRSQMQVIITQCERSS